MIPSPTPVRQSLGVRLLPATAAYDYEYWEVRLVDPSLLLGAVAVALHRLPLLAVPAGADRRGGSMDMADPVFAQALACALRGQSGFDRLTVSDKVVRWGEPVPEDLSPDARRRFQGLREEPRLGTCCKRPPVGHGGHDLDVGCWPPAPESPPGRQPTPPQVVVEADVALAP
ncbi:DUF6302 family protein [Streptomyces pilosus]|uniref:DUF6302 family protein n=1 Tax=Streptomyces pilosus TaxID=28893 RepID=UPI00362922F8